MASYTMSLKSVMESLSGMNQPIDYSQLPTLFNNVRNLLFPDFPIYDESHRIPLQNLIMSKYLNREICVTPYSYWKVLWDEKIMEIMPMYNQLYKYLSLSDNLFNDVNYTKTIKTDDTLTKNYSSKDTTNQTILYNDKQVNDSTGSENGNNTSVVTQEGEYNPGSQSLTTNIDTPQTELENFLEGKYLSSAGKTINSGTDNSSSTSHTDDTNSISRSANTTLTDDSTTTSDNTFVHNGNDKHVTDATVTETMIGKSPGRSYGEMIMELKNNIFSVDTMILDALEEMFFMVY